MRMKTLLVEAVPLQFVLTTLYSGSPNAFLDDYTSGNFMNYFGKFVVDCVWHKHM